jgi:hypothetical protein
MSQGAKSCSEPQEPCRGENARSEARRDVAWHSDDRQDACGAHWPHRHFLAALATAAGRASARGRCNQKWSPEAEPLRVCRWRSKCRAGAPVTAALPIVALVADFERHALLTVCTEHRSEQGTRSHRYVKSILSERQECSSVRCLLLVQAPHSRSYGSDDEASIRICETAHLIRAVMVPTKVVVVGDEQRPTTRRPARHQVRMQALRACPGHRRRRFGNRRGRAARTHAYGSSKSSANRGR